MTTQKPVRRDWTLLIFIIPLAVILILVVGQWAIRLVPFWSLNVGMNSNLEPDAGSARPFALLEPILPQILIPLPWAETYLLPGEDGVVSFPPFLQFVPIASPSSTPDTPAATEATPTGTAAVPSETPSPTSSATGKANNTGNEGGGGGQGTPPPTDSTSNTCQDQSANNVGQPLPCTYPPAVCTDQNANNVGQPLPCTYPPAVCTDQNANNVGQPLPCTYPPAVCTDQNANNVGQPLPCTYPPVCPGAHNPNGPLPCDYGTVSTPDPGVSRDMTPDSDINVGAAPDEGIGTVLDGKYIVLTLNIVVEPTPDNFYDLVFYEFNNGGSVYLDLIIIGITNDGTGSTYYEVFNWGNNSADTNSNVSDLAAGGEDPDEEVDVLDNNDDVPVTAPEDVLYDPDYNPGPPETNGLLPQTGILIDVDNAGSNPPPGTYQFVVIISPNNGGTPDGGNAQVDAIQAVEVPIPTP